MKKNKTQFLLALFGLLCLVSQAQVEKAPTRTEGEGPWSQLIIRGVTVIDGTLSPPIGPIDIVVENNRIASVQVVGFPGMDIHPDRRPKLKPGGKELNAEGMYLLPGFVDTHAHIGGGSQGTPAEYVFKLWMAHGITTICDPGSGNGIDWVLDQKKKSEKNEITAPRIKAYNWFGNSLNGEPGRGDITTPEAAREWVRENAKKGADGYQIWWRTARSDASCLGREQKIGITFQDPPRPIVCWQMERIEQCQGRTHFHGTLVWPTRSHVR